MLNQPEFQDTPLNRLHSLMDKAGARIGGLATCSPVDMLDLLGMLDDIEAIYNDMAAAGVDLRAEDSRRDAMQSAMQRKADIVLSKLRPIGGYAALRAKRRPTADAWWWRLDDYVAERRRLALRSLAITLGVIAAIVAIVAILFSTVLKGDPKVVARMQATQNAQAALDRGDATGALQALDEALTTQPDSSELLMWRGVVLSILKRTTEAEADFAAVKATYADEASFLVDRATIRLQAGDTDAAAADALAATKLAPDNAQAVLTLGTTQELRGQIQDALQSYQKAGELAVAQKNVSLEAFAKVKMATLLQSAPMMLPTPEPTK